MKTFKLSRKTIFKQAHEAAKAINKKGDCYAVTFAACLKLAYASASVEVAKVSRELLLNKGGKEWEKGEHHRIYFSPAFLLNHLGDGKRLSRVSGHSECLLNHLGDGKR